MTSAVPLFRDGSALARRLEQAEAKTTAHYTAAQALLNLSGGSTVSAIGDGLAFFAGAGSPINRVVGLGTVEPVDPALVDACEAFYAARGEACRIDLCPHVHPSLSAALQARGYAAGHFKQVFVRFLAGWASPPAECNGTDVAPVTPGQETLWVETLAAAEGGAPNPVARALLQPNTRKPDTVCFLAWAGGVPAGGAALAIVDGVGICYSAVVRTELRRLGAQRALLGARLAYARDHGCDLMLVHTSPGSASQRNVERCGFRLAYTKVTMTRPIPG